MSGSYSLRTLAASPNSSAVFVSLSKLRIDGLNTGICLLGKLWSCRLTTLNYFVSCKLYSSQLLIHFVPKLLQSSSSFANLDKVMFLSFFFTGMSQALATQCLIVFRHPILCVLRCIELQKLLIMAKKIVWLLTVDHFYVCGWNPLVFFWSRLWLNPKNLHNNIAFSGASGLCKTWRFFMEIWQDKSA